MNGKFGDGWNGFKCTTGHVGFGAYLIPSAVRKSYDNLSGNSPSGQISDAEILGAILGTYVGLTVFTAQVLGYGLAYDAGHPEALLLPIATNIASFTFELGDRFFPCKNRDSNSENSLEKKL